MDGLFSVEGLYDYEGGALMGVYSTLEGAIQCAVDDVSNGYGCDSYDIRLVEVDVELEEMYWFHKDELKGKTYDDVDDLARQIRARTAPDLTF